MTKRVQTPTPPNEWCYQDQGEDFRYFTKRVLLGKNEQPWSECTDEEKTAWEQAQSGTPDSEEATEVPTDTTEVPTDTTQVAEEGLGV